MKRQTRQASPSEEAPESRAAVKELRRRQLIEATISSIACHGIARTTMATITSQVGMSMGIVNFYFKTKQALLDETLRFLAGEHRDLWQQMVRDATLDPAAKLIAIVEAHFHPKAFNERNLAVWFGFYGEISSRTAYRTIMTEMDHERWEISRELCRQIIAEGGYAVDPLHVAQTLEGLYDGFFLNILIYPEDFTPTDACDRVRDYLAGIFPKHFSKPPRPAK